MLPVISLASIVVATRGRGQALVETMLIAPVLLLLLGGVADLGRAFYYKTAVTNTAREAAHWATLGPAHSDTTILDEVASPSQESYGICLVSGTTACPGGNGGLAPASVVHTAPGSAGFSPSMLANPPQPDAPLAPGSSWLFIYPDFPGRTSLAPGMHWTEVASSSNVVIADSPTRGGLQAVARAAAGSLYPLAADASASCYTWTGVTLSQTTFTTSQNAPTYTVGPLTATLTGKSGSGTAKNSAVFTINQVSVPSFQQTWTSTATTSGSIDPASASSDTVNMSDTNAATPGTYIYQVQVTSSSSQGNCQQALKTANFTVTIPPGPSPSPSPTPSPTATPSPGPTPSPAPTPTGVGGSTPPHAEQITCTVIYYFTPVTPLGLLAGNVVYIVGTATLQATY